MIKAGGTVTAARGLRVLAVGVLVALHLGALGVMVWSEPDLIGKAAFLLAWGVFNALWLLLLRRPAASAALAMTMLMLLIALSVFKHDLLFMTVSFTDVLIVDTDTVWFLLDTFTDLGWYATVAAPIFVALLVAVLWFDPVRVRTPTALVGLIVCFALLAGLSFAVPLDREEEFIRNRFLSKFARSGAVAAVDLLTRGILEADARATGRLAVTESNECQPPANLPPHLLHSHEP